MNQPISTIEEAVMAMEEIMQRIPNTSPNADNERINLLLRALDSIKVKQYQDQTRGIRLGPTVVR
jgi:chemotaxis protein histidine kinase CheA